MIRQALPDGLPSTAGPDATSAPPDDPGPPPETQYFDTAQREALLCSLLSQNPRALVRALDADGRLVEMPASIECSDQLDRRSVNALEVFSVGSRLAAIADFGVAKQRGAARTRIGLVNGSSGWAHVVDVRDTHGVLVSIVTTDSDEDLAVSLAARPAVSPRTGRMTRDEVAIVLSVDDAMCQILGYLEAELVGLLPLALVHPEDQVRSVDAWIEMLGTPGGSTRIRARQRRRDGSWVWMEITNTNMLSGPDPRVDTEMVDVSDEMAAVEALRQREQFLLRLAEVLPSGILHVDLERNVVFTNARLHEVLGVAATATLSGQLAAVAPDHRGGIERALDDVLREGRDVDLEVDLHLADRAGVQRRAIAMRVLTDAHGMPAGAVLCVDDVTDASALRAELHRRATTDELTGCLNRGAVLDTLATRLASARATSAGTAVIFMDLDGFKAVNDTFGHHVGDQLLASAADRIRTAVRAGDVVGRLGGDEFIVVAADVASTDRATELALRINAALVEPVEVAGGVPTRIRCSVGVAWTPGPDVTAEALTVAADRAMYESKRIGTAQPFTVRV